MNPSVTLLNKPYQWLRPVYERTSLHRGVIDQLDQPDLREAYSVCRQITRDHAKTFYLATRFLPYPKQRSIFAIYALCRHVDDLVDELEDSASGRRIQAAEVHQVVDRFRRDLHRAYDGDSGSNPILVAFSDTLKSFHIPISQPLELMDGVGMDLYKNRYATFDELYTYSYKVASVVGLMTSEVFGYEDPAAIRHAVDLGIAMQLTNILRDVGEDLERDRIYLPADELAAYDLTERDLFAHTYDERFMDLMAFQVARARNYYESADAGIPMLSADSRLPVIMARENYSRILDVIERNLYQVYRHRAFLTTGEKLKILPRAAWKLTVR